MYKNFQIIIEETDYNRLLVTDEKANYRICDISTIGLTDETKQKITIVLIAKYIESSIRDL